jgi:hypothetical protein
VTNKKTQKEEKMTFQVFMLFVAVFASLLLGFWLGVRCALWWCGMGD